jgi:hypothetical protein
VTLGSGWNAGHEAQTASLFPSQVVAIHWHFCPFHQLMTRKEALHPFENGAGKVSSGGARAK